MKLLRKLKLIITSQEILVPCCTMSSLASALPTHNDEDLLSLNSMRKSMAWRAAWLSAESSRNGVWFLVAMQRAGSCFLIHVIACKGQYNPAIFFLENLEAICTF